MSASVCVGVRLLLTVYLNLLKVDVVGGVGRLQVEDANILGQPGRGCGDREKRDRDGHGEQLHR